VTGGFQAGPFQPLPAFQQGTITVDPPFWTAMAAYEQNLFIAQRADSEFKGSGADSMFTVKGNA